MLKHIAKLIIALNGNLGKTQIAAGFAWGVLLGLIPVSIFWIVLFLVSFFFAHHHASKLFAMTILKLLSGLTAPFLDMVGWQVLHHEALWHIYVMFFNMPFIPFTRFNNTLIAGGIAVGVILWLPVFFVTMPLIPLYRYTIAPKIRENKLVKSIKGVPIISRLSKIVSRALDAQLV